MNNNDEKSFKVQDKRRFDETGTERLAGAQTEQAPTTEAGEASEVSFVSFAISLGTQAHMLLGDVPPPGGVNLSVDPQAAKQIIDILSMLREKTKGNLDQSEQKLVDDILHNLRVSFLKKAK